jgi:UDP-N-acetylmuramoyl-L-alanyl-D-glutamate--2,6-diaminopimelate ligase
VGLLNANYADGIDTSWIWDGDFEQLADRDIPTVITGGERYKDITFRLKVAGIPDDRHIVEPNLEKVVDEIKKVSTDRVYVLATYTAMLQMRKILADKGYVKEGLGL